MRAVVDGRAVNAPEAFARDGVYQQVLNFVDVLAFRVVDVAQLA